MLLRTVVLVEGDPGMEDLVQVIVEQLAGAEVVVAHDIDEAVVLVRQVEPALVIVDEDPRSNLGRMLLDSLKADAGTREIPVVALCDDADLGRQLVSDGAEAFLPKPFDVNDLLALVQFYTQASPRGLAERL